MAALFPKVVNDLCDPDVIKDGLIAKLAESLRQAIGYKVSIRQRSVGEAYTRVYDRGLLSSNSDDYSITGLAERGAFSERVKNIVAREAVFRQFTDIQQVTIEQLWSFTGTRRKSVDWFGPSCATDIMIVGAIYKYQNSVQGSAVQVPASIPDQVKLWEVRILRQWGHGARAIMNAQRRNSLQADPHSRRAAIGLAALRALKPKA